MVKKTFVAKKPTSFEKLISNSLRIGVFASAFVILIGFLLYILLGTGGYPHDSFPNSLGAIFIGLWLLKPYAIILAGLFLLILTPVFRVGICLALFIKEKDPLYALISFIVLSILIISFISGRIG